MKLIVIDEISVVSSVVFYQVRQRLNEIFGCSTELPFSRLLVLLCEDLCQLPPVKGAPVYCCGTENIKGILSLELWRRFKIAELTKVMRQQGDHEYTLVLNKIRVGGIDSEVEKLLLSRSVANNSPLYTKHVVHMFAENSRVVDYK